MIIALSGRLQSGKTELSQICVKYGFTRIYFALPLKTLIAKLLDITIEEVNALKNVNNLYIFNETQLQTIIKETEIEEKIVRAFFKDKTFHNTREMLQQIGTDLIRNYNPNWHVDRIERIINENPTTDYIIDDLRFTNEKLMIENHFGHCFFIIRPKLDCISNHESETSLRWQDFHNVIINDTSIEYLKFNWENFLKNDISKSLIKRNQILDKIDSDEEYKEKLLNQTEPFNIFDSYFISKHFYRYEPLFIAKTNEIDKIIPFENKIYYVYYTNGNVNIITNPLMIEDLKFIV